MGLDEAPTGFIPVQDQGYLIVVIQLPSGAALSRTTTVAREIAKRALQVDGAADAVIISGFDGATFTNTTSGAAVFVTLKPFDERARAGRNANAILADITKQTASVQEARVIVVAPPPVRGLGNGGGFKMQVQSRQSSEIGPLLGPDTALVSSVDLYVVIIRVCKRKTNVCLLLDQLAFAYA